MDKIFGSLKSVTKFNGVIIDNNVFRLHYKATVLVLCAFSIIVTSRQYVGDPINCISRDAIPQNILDTFCWIHSTFSVVSAWEKKVGDEIPYPGVEKFTVDQKRVYHAYYQWVCFVLFLQAILFYIPRYMWKIWEGDKVNSISMDLNSPILSEPRKKECILLITNYLFNNLHNHSLYVFCYFTCEVLNFINVIGQIYLMDLFLGGEFSWYGSNVLKFNDWTPDLHFDPMIKVFPRLTKCTFYRYGPSGDVQRHDAMCILSINIINEKIYLFLWFWFHIIAVLSALVILYRFIIIFCPRARFLILKSRARLTSAVYLETVINKCKLGDWFLLDLLCENIEPLNYRDLIHVFAKRLDGETVDMLA